LRFFIHYFLHIGIPVLVAFFLFKTEWKKIVLLFLATLVIDIDHLWASPIYDPHRCSIGFHTFHTNISIGFYVLLVFFKKPFNLIGIGLLFHMLTDALDCYLMK
tara:strand:+ start:6948 stop:7259 length:312 start_codon:yes stop_codon:yes gene_type:complete